MSPEKQRIAIATACGWTDCHFPLASNVSLPFTERVLCGIPPHSTIHKPLPDYPNDLNAMHEVKKVMKGGMRSKYDAELTLVIRRDYNFIWEFTAEHEAEAFLRTLGLWEEEANTTKSASSTSLANEQADHETAEQKVAWLTEILVTKSCDPVFADYWLRLARRNLLLGLPLKTEEPDLNLATEESSATDHFRDTTKMVSGESSAAVKESFTTQPQPIDSAPKEMRILVYCQRAATSEGWWQIGQFDQAIGEWLDDVVDGEFLLVKPTCWLPLPPHPTQPNP